MLWDILTYPLILLGLFRGAFLTYQCVEKKDDSEKKEQLEYWIVISALIFVFPKIEFLLSFFLFSGLVGIIKFGLLFAVVVGKTKGYGFLYKLIEEQFIGNIEPYLEEGMRRSEGIRKIVCSTSVLYSAYAQRNVVKMLMGSISDQHLYYLSKSVNKQIKDIQKEQAIREKDNNSQKSEKTENITANSKSIFETDK